jgi:hypothetical protein
MKENIKTHINDVRRMYGGRINAAYDRYTETIKNVHNIYRIYRCVIYGMQKIKT